MNIYSPWFCLNFLTFLRLSVYPLEMCVGFFFFASTLDYDFEKKLKSEFYEELYGRRPLYKLSNIVDSDPRFVGARQFNGKFSILSSRFHDLDFLRFLGFVFID